MVLAVVSPLYGMLRGRPTFHSIGSDLEHYQDAMSLGCVPRASWRYAVSCVVILVALSAVYNRYYETGPSGPFVRIS